MGSLSVLSRLLPRMETQLLSATSHRPKPHDWLKSKNKQELLVVLVVRYPDD